MANEDRFSQHFLGFHTDFDFTADASKPVKEFISPLYLGAGACYGYGRSSWFRPRVRASIGWIFDGGFTPSIGVELPIVEVLDGGKAKLFGVYINGDVGYSFGHIGSFVYRLAPYIRIPLGNLEGFGVGATYHSENGWSVFIGRVLGAYPLKN